MCHRCISLEGSVWTLTDPHVLLKNSVNGDSFLDWSNSQPFGRNSHHLYILDPWPLYSCPERRWRNADLAYFRKFIFFIFLKAKIKLPFNILIKSKVISASWSRRTWSRGCRRKRERENASETASPWAFDSPLEMLINIGNVNPISPFFF